MKERREARASGEGEGAEDDPTNGSSADGEVGSDMRGGGGGSGGVERRGGRGDGGRMERKDVVSLRETGVGSRNQM
jgi:hypothetical protein